MFGLYGYADRCNSHELERVTESKTKNKSALAFGDVESCLSSDVIAGDVDIYGSIVLKVCSGHTSDDGVPVLQVLLGEPYLWKHGG